ncbi:DUF5908 family protein [Cyclobacterium marinum]|uniref:Uncharacterized protein n=1 Tax=Cyclobacterium marinum (strain ATCC 25205 / DSM 745 / LMG 13164 / NCIMB 1802) TaxID=880070 RepID=G0J5K2_CYCMS|nr:DUF5908 family protein [Cyclobacterium marinum]AEL28451.1 hypothetical protein Cycma_4766 [Cyclobacterium marinum DSM 745]MBI0398301.1 hypothetical protein [Cyclobacterium marinum]|tara:strand:+ start:222032 stop:222181 length:150 start_codon:yes stop_codon:yes gene_type:complete
MAINIKEMHIKFHVEEAGKAKKSEGVDKEKVVAECVEQVMEILKSNKER